MNDIIRIDGGAVGANNQFGTATVTREILHALGTYDQHNHYLVYTQHDTPLSHYLNITYRSVSPIRGWNTIGVPLQELRFIGQGGRYLALNQAVPVFTAAPVISICHGLSFHAYPEAYPESHGATRLEQLTKTMIKRSDYILVSSKKIKHELQTWYGVSSSRIVTIPFGIPQGFMPSKRFKRKKIILWVGSTHPIKQLSLALDAFSVLLQKKGFGEYKLVLAGVLKQTPLPHGVIALGHVSQEDLHKLYCEAQCVLVTSLYESFHFPTLEALACGTSVVTTAFIPEFKPYVATSDATPEALAVAMVKTIKKPLIPSYELLEKEFSWKKYVKSLTRLYQAYRVFGDTDEG